MSYHINRKTNKVGICRAYSPQSCPLGGKHYDDPSQAWEDLASESGNGRIPNPLTKENSQYKSIPLSPSNERNPKINKFDENGWRSRSEWIGGYENKNMMEHVSGGYIVSKPFGYKAVNSSGQSIGENFTKLDKAMKSLEIFEEENRAYWCYLNYAPKRKKS